MLNNIKIKLAVITGGPSFEHDVSLATAKVVLGALDKNKYEISIIIVDKNEEWIMPDGERFSENAALNILKEDLQIDVVFIAIHGKFGEDGTLQKLLDQVGIPYTGSSAEVSEVAINQISSNILFIKQGLLVPEYVVLSRNDEPDNIELPCVVKPAKSGSSIGITIVKKQDDLKLAVDLAFKYDDEILIQKYIKGDEVACAILDEGNGKDPIALPPTQIIPKESEYFDYHAKYTPGATEEITPPQLPEEIIKNIQSTALKAHKAIGCSGMSRTDMIVGGDKIYVLEINTIPGMTETSLYPQAAVAAGISFSEILDRIIQSGLSK